MINRSALILRPKRPFLDWAAGLSDSGLVPRVGGEHIVYLIPDFGTPDDLTEIIGQVFRELFENELWSWHTDESAWPANRDLETFHEWFTVEAHSIVEDLCGDEILDDGLEADD